MKDGKYGFIDKDGKEKIPFVYDKATSFSEGLAYFQIDNTYGFINQEGEEVILLDCDSISSFKEGLAKVRKGIYTGVIGIDCKEIIPAEYDYVQIGEIYIKTRKDDTETIPPTYDSIGTFHEGYARVDLDDKYGLIDKKGNMVIPIGEYDYINQFSKAGDYQIFKKNGKEGLLDSNGKKVVSASYDYISSWYGDVYHSNTSFLATNYHDSIRDHIIVVGEYLDIDLSEIILVNEITPKLQPYHDYIQKCIVDSEFPASSSPTSAIISHMRIPTC